MSGARRVILIGGGEHARVVADALHSAGDAQTLVGYVSEKPVADDSAMGLRYLGSESVLAEHADASAVLAFAGIARWPVRREEAERLGSRVAGWATVVHGRAWVSPTATIAAGTVVMAGAVIQTGARIGAHCVVNSGAIVEHDVVLGDNVHVATNAAIGGGSTVGPDVYIGLGASVRDHVTIGAGAVIAMGAVVTGDVAPASRVRGVPAR